MILESMESLLIKMSSLLDSIAVTLYNINPSLCDSPPRGLEDEFCYLGPNGKKDGAILCRDIPYEHSISVGSWMLEPKKIVIEGIVGISICFLMLIWLIPKLRAISPMMKTIQHPKGSPLLSLFCLTMILYYKIIGFKNKVFYIVMPCNFQWCLSFLQCYVVPNSYKFMHYSMLQMRLSYLMSVVIAIATPETDDCTAFGEYEFYWINHFLLLLLPLAYIMNGSVSCYPSESSRCSILAYNFYWWLFSCICFFIFYFGPVTLIAISTGLNLNFMLHPPNDHFLLKGQNFRIVATASLGFFYAVSRVICLNVEKSFGPANKLKIKSQ